MLFIGQKYAQNAHLLFSVVSRDFATVFFFFCRFVRECIPSVDELERGALAHGIQKLLCSAAPDRYPSNRSAYVA